MSGFRMGYKKYNAKRTNGFASRLEEAVWFKLLEREKLKEISNIERQCAVVLQDGSSDIRISWKVDFCFVENSSGKTVYAEAKGFPTDEYKLKLKLFKAKRIGDIEIWGGRWQYPKLIEKWVA